MRTIYSLSDSVTQHIKQLYRFELSSKEIAQKTTEYIDNLLLTASGKQRYPLKYGFALRQVAHQVHTLERERLTVFGYKYKGVFYGAGHNARNSSNPDIKTTRELEKLLPLNHFNDSPDVTSGIYYIDSLKPYFVSNN